MLAIVGGAEALAEGGEVGGEGSAAGGLEAGAVGAGFVEGLVAGGAALGGVGRVIGELGDGDAEAGLDDHGSLE